MIFTHVYHGIYLKRTVNSKKDYVNLYWFDVLMGGGVQSKKKKGPQTDSIGIIFLNQFKKQFGKKSNVSVFSKGAKNILINHSRQC